ncbi:MAG: hypothetical protein KA191_17560 [Verrucomicrobia bacterium]|jgi:hypothetical protein|nr:hypothetical protein [Verrucomicrobiota bacterium]OQC68212.1 MAG: hypothetical protein BWX48_00153 [Verrucomicrobia bacterium ADurb.Bin006]HOA63152.1 hypothetical protein [Verrucomicrobiota bacterium]HOF49961.1 hypothetical protein [Verrucomicrobiota bacterium]HOH41414.1 hypothetical protein [Verrucomicrobiota bacterium]
MLHETTRPLSEAERRLLRRRSAVPQTGSVFWLENERRVALVTASVGVVIVLARVGAGFPVIDAIVAGTFVLIRFSRYWERRPAFTGPASAGGPPPLRGKGMQLRPPQSARGLASPKTRRTWLGGFCFLLYALGFWVWGQNASVDGRVVNEGDDANTDGLFFSESFEDANLRERGWYDLSQVRISGGAAAGQGCIEYEWTDAQSGTHGSAAARHLFTPTDEVAIRFYLKLSPGWGWSGQNYHPHLTHFMTSENSAWHGLAASHLTLYIEPVAGRLRLAAQDIQNEKMPHGLTQGPLRGGYNGRLYDSEQVLFQDDQWHCVEAYFKLNTLDLENDRANPDGVARGWCDGRLVIERTNLVLRSPDFPQMKFNQFLMAPYFGPGLLPHPQRLWIDELAVGRKRIGSLAARSPGGHRPNRPPARGLSAAYPDDAGIQNDPAVVFVENFEGTDFRQWNNAEPPRAPAVQLVSEKDQVYGGRQAVQFTVPAGRGVGAGLVKWFKPGYDQLHARWYCRFAEDYDQGDLHHTGAKLAAESDRWHLGVAGQKPTGRDFFITGLEPWRDWQRNPPPGELMFYTYYPDMKRDPDGNWWGNSFKPEKKFLLTRGRWYCLEIMVKANTPGQADGEQAFWVDGELIGRFTGIRWRDTDTLKLNCFWPSMYIHESPQTNRVWMDDMVVATAYIGPKVPRLER